MKIHQLWLRFSKLFADTSDSHRFDYRNVVSTNVSASTCRWTFTNPGAFEQNGPVWRLFQTCRLVKAKIMVILLKQFHLNYVFFMDPHRLMNTAANGQLVLQRRSPAFAAVGISCNQKSKASTLAELFRFLIRGVLE